MNAVSATRRPDLDALADLEEQRDFLLRSLDDLEREREAGDLDDADYAALHDDYTRRTAEVLRAIEQGRAALVPPPRAGGWGRRLAVVAGVGALAVGAGFAVAQSSGSRMPGDTLTGTVEQTSSGDLQRAAELAQAGEITEALRLYDEILERDPEQFEALTERGLLLVSVGQGTERSAVVEEGKASIDRALALDPENPRALFYLGLALRLEGDDAGSDAAFDRALAADPPAALRRQIEEFRSFAGGAGGGATGASGDLPPPVTPEAPPPAG